MLLVSFTFACKKNGLDPVTNTTPSSDYDVTNKVLRVDVKSSGTAFSVHLMQIRPGYGSRPYSELRTRQNLEFNYGFSPAVGDTIKVVIQSNAKITQDASYIGVDFNPTVNQTTDTGGQHLEYNYVVKN